MFTFLPVSAILLVAVVSASARSCIQPGHGTIALEEHWALPSDDPSILSPVYPPLGGTVEELYANLEDIHKQRLEAMDTYNIDYMVLSFRAPGIQAVSDPVEAVSQAFEANNLLASLVSNNTRRFGAFAALPMHNASKAAEELRRTVEDLGFLGGLIYDYQQGPKNSTLFYDGPDYDAFWKTVTELGVPIYLHPRPNIPAISDLLYKDAPWLAGAGQEFTTTISNHVLRLCANGVFDRFPTAQVAVGHMGERLPSDFYRIDGVFDRWRSTVGIPMKRKLSDYWQSNIHQTSSGDFTTPLFRFHRELLGIGRILFSIDYPFESIAQANEWVDSLYGLLSGDELRAFKKGNAMKLLKLDECEE
ncbi:hypothetical protein PM082_010844 [Marasmius tenuissimus]|nr:hypothetical protein PM082_010844 [Marasmius tenuissimus]